MNPVHPLTAIVYLGMFVVYPLVWARKAWRRGHKLMAFGLNIFALLMIAMWVLANMSIIGSNSNKTFGTVGASAGGFPTVKRTSEPTDAEPK